LALVGWCALGLALGPIAAAVGVDEVCAPAVTAWLLLKLFAAGLSSNRSRQAGTPPTEGAPFGVAGRADSIAAPEDEGGSAPPCEEDAVGVGDMFGCECVM
jgi:hypothetical protein